MKMEAGMRAKYARQIRRGIYHRLQYNQMYQSGEPIELLNWKYWASVQKCNPWEWSAFHRTTRNDSGRVSTRHRQPFINPELPRDGSWK